MLTGGCGAKISERKWRWSLLKVEPGHGWRPFGFACPRRFAGFTFDALGSEKEASRVIVTD